MTTRTTENSSVETLQFYKDNALQLRVPQILVLVLMSKVLVLVDVVSK